VATREVTTARDSAEEARSRLTRLVPLESEEAALRQEVARIEASRAERAEDVERSVRAVERRQGLERSLESLKGEIDRMGEEVERRKNRLEDRAVRVRALREAHGEVERRRDAAAEAKRRLSAAQDELAETKAARARLDAQLDDAVRRVKAAERGRQERAELTAEAKQTEDKATWVGTAFRSAVLGMEQKLLTHAQALFEREFARYFASLVDDPGLVARTDPAFTPLVMIEGEWTPAEALSGGERTSLALAFRLALARVVRSMGSLHLDTILLDEPTDGFSPEQVIRMGELLEELALPQVILVSHESQLSAIADRVVRVQKVDGRSVLDTSAPLRTDSVGGLGPSTLEKPT
jgi:exonuclease SbcC